MAESEACSDPAWVDGVLAFWFEDLQPSHWFQSDALLDARIRERFLTVYQDVARDCDTAAATKSAPRALATVIVLDQCSRNMFRGTPQAFATDALALAVARDAVAAALDVPLTLHQRLFLYLPFEHSEALVDQHRAVALIGALGDTEYTRYAEAHRAIIARFGRFPHRNAQLGRASTPDEIDFLRQPGSSF